MLKKLLSMPMLAAILLYILIEPFFVWEFSRNEYFLIISSFLLSFLFFINNNIKKDLRLFIYILLVLFLLWVTGKINIFGFIVSGFSILLPFGKDEFTKQVFKYFSNIYAFIITISSIVWIFVLLGFISPMGTIEPINTIKTYNYNVYPLTVSANSLVFFRFHGPFDEPGVVGTFNGVLLYALGFDKRDWKTYGLLFSGFLSLSLFFFIVVALFYVVKYISSFKISHFVLLGAFLFAFYNLTSDNEIISNSIWNRLEWDAEKGTLSGDTRTHEEAQRIYEQKQWTIDYWLGDKNYKNYLDDFEGSSTYKIVVLQYGMILFALYFLFFIFFALKYCDKKTLILFLIIYLSSIYQRPGVFGVHYFFLFPYFAKFAGQHINAVREERMLRKVESM